MANSWNEPEKSWEEWLSGIFFEFRPFVCALIKHGIDGGVGRRRMGRVVSADSVGTLDRNQETLERLPIDERFRAFY
jgi:hypothetical protein